MWVNIRRANILREAAALHQRAQGAGEGGLHGQPVLETGLKTREPGFF